MMKRKAAPSSQQAAKANKVITEDRPPKRQKADSSRKPLATTEAKSKTSESRTTIPIISRLKEEEPLFPRGGGSVLTPLEHKEIQIQAKQDALFEQEAEGAVKKGNKTARTKRKSFSKDSFDVKKLVRDEDTIKIESLNFKVRSHV